MAKLSIQPVDQVIQAVYYVKAKKYCFTQEEIVFHDHHDREALFAI